MLVDTDVLIWHLRGYRPAAQRLDQLPALTGNSKHFEAVATLAVERFEP